MNKILQILIIIVSFGAGIFMSSLFKGCGHKETVCKEQSVKDSVHITHITHIDTIPFPYKVPVVITAKNPAFDSTLYKECDVTRYTNTPLKDSLVDGNILTTIRQNQLVEAKFTYKPLFPKYIYRTDSIIKDSIHTTTVYEPYKQLIFYVGGSVGTNDIGVSANIKTRKDLIYGYKFGMTYSGIKTHSIEFKIPLIKTKHKNK